MHLHSRASRDAAVCADAKANEAALESAQSAAETDSDTVAGVAADATANTAVRDAYRVRCTIASTNESMVPVVDCTNIVPPIVVDVLSRQVVASQLHSQMVTFDASHDDSLEADERQKSATTTERDKIVRVFAANAQQPLLWRRSCAPDSKST